MVPARGRAKCLVGWLTAPAYSGVGGCWNCVGIAKGKRKRPSGSKPSGGQANQVSVKDRSRKPRYHSRYILAEQQPPQPAPPQPRPPERQAEPTGEISDEFWDDAVTAFRMGNLTAWPRRLLGEPPGHPDCRVPLHVRRRSGF